MNTASSTSPTDAPSPDAPAPASPASDVRTRGRDPRDTPAMRQYAHFKAQHPDCVLFFRMGDFYEMFDDDARLVHRVLGLTLTQRTEGVPMAGMPYHAMEGYLRKMIERGYRVAVCEQVQDPAEAKGIVERAVTRVLTPGTLVDEALLEEGVPNQVAAIQFTGVGEESPAVLAVAEVSTGSFLLMDLPIDRIRDEMARLRPSELLYVETADGAVPPRVRQVEGLVGCSLTARPSWTFRHRDARDLLLQHYGVSTLEGFGLEEEDPALGAAGALLRYLQETQSPDGAEVHPMAHLRPPRREAPDDHLIIDATSLASLEIERTMRTGETGGSLLSIFTRCSTPMGKRLLRRWLCYPLRDRAAILDRQRSVAALVDDADLCAQLTKHAGEVQDVARIAGRVAMLRATPRDLVALGRSTDRIEAIASCLEERPAFTSAHQRLAALAGDLQPLAKTILERCVEMPPPHLREGGLFRDGVDAELDEARLLQRDASSWLAAYQKRLIEQTEIPSLKVGYNRVFGYYIEITHTHTEKVPPGLVRKQTLKNAERYITEELKDFEDKITTAQARAMDRERLLFERLCRHASTHAVALAEYAEIVAELDVLNCFADAAVRFGYVRPEIVAEPVIDICGGRHPVLDRALGERFVPNDCRLGVAVEAGAAAASRESGSGIGTAEEGRPDDEEAAGVAGGDASGSGGSKASLALITGPNMAGKSTAIRQVALIVLLSHTGCFVPADTATIGLTDRIFTRIGASDELHAGKSTFMVEMTETANILHHATERSLVILDEIGRGTSTLDGLALAWAIAETMADIGCRTLFATHYHELTALADRLPNVTNLHVSVREWGEEIIFLYRILPGRTDRSYGIHVAKIAGLPGRTLERARQVLDTLAVHTEVPGIPATTSGVKAAQQQLSLFTEFMEHPVVEQMRHLDLNELTPLAAFDALRRLVDAVRGDAADHHLPRSTLG